MSGRRRGKLNIAEIVAVYRKLTLSLRTRSEILKSLRKLTEFKMTPHPGPVNHPHILGIGILPQ